MAHILFVDDEIVEPRLDDDPDSDKFYGYMAYYLDELRRKNYVVSECRGVDDALEKLEKRSDYDVAIIDVMMDPGTAFAEADTVNGMRTGVFLAKHINVNWPHIKLILLSNAVSSRPGTPGITTYQELLDTKVCERILFKLDQTPTDLVDSVQDVLQLKGG